MSAPTSKGTALITGASTGIGAVYADRLAKRGYDLILVARSQEKLSEVAARLKSTGRRIETIAADLTKKEDVQRVAERLSTDPTITALVNNAGLGSAAKASRLEDRRSRVDDLSECHRADAAGPCRPAWFCGAQERPAHQHCLRRCPCARASERHLQRHQGLRRELYAGAEERSGRQRRDRAGCVARRNCNAVLGQRPVVRWRICRARS